MGDAYASVPSLLILASLAFIGALAMIAFFRFYGIAFLGAARSARADMATEAKLGLRMPIFILSLGILITGSSPIYLYAS
jgi:hypothetical protein